MSTSLASLDLSKWETRPSTPVLLWHMSAGIILLGFTSNVQVLTSHFTERPDCNKNAAQDLMLKILSVPKLHQGLPHQSSSIAYLKRFREKQAHGLGKVWAYVNIGDTPKTRNDSRVSAKIGGFPLTHLKLGTSPKATPPHLLKKTRHGPALRRNHEGGCLNNWA